MQLVHISYASTNKGSVQNNNKIYQITQTPDISNSIASWLSMMGVVSPYHIACYQQPPQQRLASTPKHYRGGYSNCIMHMVLFQHLHIQIRIWWRSECCSHCVSQRSSSVGGICVRQSVISLTKKSLPLCHIILALRSPSFPSLALTSFLPDRPILMNMKAVFSYSTKQHAQHN